MKAILEFNLPEDNEDYNQYIMAPKLSMALWEITHNLRKHCERLVDEDERGGVKYSSDDVIHVVFEEICNTLTEYNINTNDLA